MFWKKDNVCKARIKSEEYQIKYNGKTYYFDSEACMKTFEKEPERFARKEKICGFLEKIIKSKYNLPKCH